MSRDVNWCSIDVCSWRGTSEDHLLGIFYPVFGRAVIKEKEFKRDRRQENWSSSKGRLKLLRTIRVALRGKRLRSMSHFS